MMNLTQLKYRELDKFLVVIFPIKTEVVVEIDGMVKTRNLYIFVGINMEGRRKFLTYGIDSNEDTEFWIQKFKNIARRGVEKVMYITLGEEKGKRAAQITFPGIKILPTAFTLIDKISPYYADTYKNKMPEEIRKLFICETKEEYEIARNQFMHRYEKDTIVKILLEKDIKEIEEVYEIPHNIRRLVFTFYFIRDYKRIMKKEMNKEKIIINKEEFMMRFEELITTWEKTMYVSKKEWLKIVDELILIDKEIVRYL